MHKHQRMQEQPGDVMMQEQPGDVLIQKQPGDVITTIFVPPVFKLWLLKWIIFLVCNWILIAYRIRFDIGNGIICSTRL